jgi:hypothetical protein
MKFTEILPFGVVVFSCGHTDNRQEEVNSSFSQLFCEGPSQGRHTYKQGTYTFSPGLCGLKQATVACCCPHGN